MRTIIESPLKGKDGTEYARNKRYALWCLRDSLDRGEAPFASHLLYTQVLDDRIEGHREMGIAAGFSWVDAAELVVFYEDLGYSSGMLRSRDRLASGAISTTSRKLRPWAMSQFLEGKVPEFT